jgi:hypothetical protein
MQRHTVLLLPIFLAALVPLGCDQSMPKVDEDIVAFVEAQPLPESQDPELVFSDGELDASAFWVSFGEARDCPSGCFYSKAYGLKHQGRIGWMGLDAYGEDDSVATKVSYFDVQRGDSTLFKEGIRDRFEEAQEQSDRSYAHATYDRFLEMLGEDEDTPPSTLLELAGLLKDEYRPELGRVLVENPVVRSSEPILEILARLPERSGYETVRDRAQDLLDQLSEE